MFNSASQLTNTAAHEVKQLQNAWKVKPAPFTRSVKNLAACKQVLKVVKACQHQHGKQLSYGRQQ